MYNASVINTVIAWVGQTCLRIVFPFCKINRFRIFSPPVNNPSSLLATSLKTKKSSLILTLAF